MSIALRLRAAGFTLIELSIVLVIIGLIVGAVLVGQDLIKAAQLRAIVSEKESYQVAARTFQIKYGKLPGDLKPAQATMFGFEMTGRDGLKGKGDGNGIITPTTNLEYLHIGENALFWDDLSVSGLISGDYTLNTAGSKGVNVLPQNASKYVPQANLKECYWLIGRSYLDYKNYFFLRGFPAALAFGSSNGAIASGQCLTPLDAYQLELKTDDGKPLSGNTLAVGTGTYTIYGSSWYTHNFTTTSPGAGDCVDSDDGDGTYAINVDAAKNVIGCGLGLRFQ